MSEKVVKVSISTNYGVGRRILRGVLQFFNSPEAGEIVMNRVMGPFDPWAFEDENTAGIIAHVTTREMADYFGSTGVPVVNTSGVLDLDLPSVRLDDEAIGRVAAEHFIERGYRHLAFVGHTLRAYATRRLRGFEQALAEHDLKCVSFLLDFPQGGARPWLQTVSRWLREQVRPLGVFTDNDECGQAILTACRMAELRVPEEIAVLGVDDDDLFCETQKPGLSSIESPNEHVGLVAARRVCEMIRAGVTSAPSVLVGPGEVVVRRSTDTLVVEDDAVRQALEFMRSQFHRRIAVDDILRHVPISRRNLERRFRTALGQSILEELTRLRLAAAMRALARTDLSVADVAAQSGFSNSTHLGVVMRQRLGVSPRTYRRRARNPVAPALTQAPAVAQNVE